MSNENLERDGEVVHKAGNWRPTNEEIREFLFARFMEKMRVECGLFEIDQDLLEWAEARLIEAHAKAQN